MKLALLQINDGEEIYLIDTLSIPNPGDDCNFLFSNYVLKIFHSCKEDLEAVYSWTNRKMENIFDTQLADALLGNEFSISYQKLVENRLDIMLEKKETRSNWLKRPLSNDQLKYASLDVEYLIYLYKELKSELFVSKKIDWLNEDIEQLIEITFPSDQEITVEDRIISKTEENDLLLKFNEIVTAVAKKEKINVTLFFSKKNQRDFLRALISKGTESAFERITFWRRQLLQDKLLKLLG
tara:strand:- start:1116 stop:1832 length:717 start_codon:yes stop_codon:yes gene_type:complete